MRSTLLFIFLIITTLTTVAQTWSRIGNMPGHTGRFSLSCFTYGANAYAVGGAVGNTLTYSDTMWSYNPATNKWIYVSRFPGGHRTGMSSFVIGDTAYIGLGEDDGSYACHNDFYAFDMATHHWHKRADFIGGYKYNCSTFAIGDYGYIAAGSTGGPPYTNDAYKFNPKTNSWSTLPPVPGPPTSGAGVCVINGSGYIIGGLVHPGDSRYIIKFDTSTQSWSIPTEFKDSTITENVVLNFCNTLYITTGLRSDTVNDNNFPSNCVYIFNPLNYSLTRTTNFPGTSRSHAFGFSFNNKGYLVGGYDYGTGALYNDVWRITDSTNILRISDSFICQGQAITLRGAIAKDMHLAFHWNTGDTAADIAVNTPGKYVVTISGGTLCMSQKDSFIVRALILPSHQQQVENYCFTGNTIVLEASPGFATYLWQTGDTGRQFKTIDTGLYTVRIHNSCGNATDSFRINLSGTCCLINLPNAFTPGTNINNKCRILSDCTFEAFDFRIYNRWGQQIFETHNPKQWWDGTYNGKPQPQDVYMWQIMYKKAGAELKKLTGDVTLIR